MLLGNSVSKIFVTGGAGFIGSHVVGSFSGLEEFKGFTEHR